MRFVTFTARGLPTTQGSTRAFVVQGKGKKPRAVVTHDKSTSLLEWRRSIGDACKAEVGGTVTWECPVEVCADFYLPRPVNHYLPANSRRPAPVLKPTAPLRPTTKPDVDKTARALLDALTQDAALYRDDSQVVSLTSRKWYADGRPPGVDVTVREVPLG